MEDKDQPPLKKEANKSINLGPTAEDVESSIKINTEIKQAEQKLDLTAANSIQYERKQPSETKAFDGNQKQSNIAGESKIEKSKASEQSLFGQSPIQNHAAILAIVLTICLSIALMFPAIVGLRLSALYAVSNALPANQSIHIILDYADNLASTKHYDQAISIYKIATKKIKDLNLNKQLLSLVDFKLALVLVETEPAKNKEIHELISEALTNLGEPNNDTPNNLVETIRKLAVCFMDKDDLYTAYPLVQAMSRFGQTGIARNSEGNTFTDLGEKFKAKQSWALAYICYEHAFSISKSWGDTNYNTYRLGHMGLAKAHLNQVKDALAMLSQAIDMDKRVHHDALSISTPLLPVYVDTLIKSNEIYEAKKVLKNFYSYFDTKDYYDCQKKLALAYQKNKNNNKAINILKDMLQDDIAGKDVPNVPAIKKALSALEKSNSSRVK